MALFDARRGRHRCRPWITVGGPKVMRDAPKKGRKFGESWPRSTMRRRACSAPAASRMHDEMQRHAVSRVGCTASSRDMRTMAPT